MRREAWPPARMTRVRVRPQGEDEADEEGRGRRGRGRSVRAGKGGASVGTRRERSELATKALDVEAEAPNRDKLSFTIFRCM